MATRIVFFDLPAKEPCLSWSPNPWKTRLLLNFKGLDYQTQWVEYPDIKPALENHVAPNADGFAYSIPTVKLPDGTYIMDSRKIASYLEELHPSPKTHLDSPYLPKVEDLWNRYMEAVVPISFHEIPKRVLNESSRTYWYKTKEEYCGMPLDQFAAQEGGSKAWDAAEPSLREATALLRENKGPYFMGDTVSYADFVWASILLFNQRLGDDVFQEALKRAGDKQPHLDLLEGIKDWIKVDSA